MPLPPGTLLNINVPGSLPTRGRGRAARQSASTETALDLVDEAPGNRRLFRIYGEADFEPGEVDTDLVAVAAGTIAVTPLHFDLTHHEGIAVARPHDLDRLLPPEVRSRGSRE